MKRKKILRYVVLPFMILLMAGLLYAYKEFKRTHNDTATLAPDYSLATQALIKEFENNEQQATKKYAAKTVEVKGKIKDVVKDERGLYVVVLGDEASTSTVRCSIDSVHNTEAATVRKGSNVAVKGICSGFSSDELLGSDVVLVRSVIDNKN